MFLSNEKRRSRRAAADTTERFVTSKMSLCRACLVLLGPQDAVHDLHNEKELALKFLACIGRSMDALLPPQNEEMHIVLKCICETCYQLVQKFHDFQRMCEESLQNFEKLLLEASPTDSEKNTDSAHQKEIKATTLPDNQGESMEENEFVDTNKQILVSSTVEEAIEDIEEVYIVEDEAFKEAQATSFVAAPREENTIAPPTMVVNRVITTRRRGQRQTLDCSICLRGFYKASLLEAHMKMHKGEHPYTCVHCGKIYARANLLHIHLREMHLKVVKTYPCTFDNCDKVYKASRSLNFHINQQHRQLSDTAASADTHMCDKCGKTYTRIGHLNRHKWVHMSKGERPFGCETCGQRFYTKQFLADHLLRRHSNNNLLRCKKCGRILATRAALVAHMQKTHKSLTWKCDTCKRNFSTMSNLRTHKRTVHARLRPHACSFCAASFAKRQHLVNHEMRHTGERQYKCVPCKLAFIQQVAYQRHMRVHKVREPADEATSDAE